MKAITLHQPWASLVALGVKTIETRSWRTSYRGPLAIHAAATTKGFDLLPGDCEGTTEAGWRYGYIGDFQAGYCYRSSDEGQRGDTFLVRLDGDPLEVVPPLGAVVATAMLVDVAPIGGPYSFRTGIFEGDEGDYPEQNVVVFHPAIGGASHRPALILDRAHGRSDDVSDQLPYGDFRPGRFAWLLEEITPIGAVPARGRQQLWEWAA